MIYVMVATGTTTLGFENGNPTLVSTAVAVFSRTTTIQNARLPLHIAAESIKIKSSLPKVKKSIKHYIESNKIFHPVQADVIIHQGAL